MKALKELKESNGSDIIDITPTEDSDGAAFYQQLRTAAKRLGPS